MINSRSLLKTRKNIISLLFPISCISCEGIRENAYLCSQCRKKLTPHLEECHLCHKKFPHYQTCFNCIWTTPLQWVIVCFSYKSYLKKLILTLKFWLRYTVADFLAKRLEFIILSHPILSEELRKWTIYISSVPSHRWRRRRIKGYNQSELLAQCIALHLHIKYISLVKKKSHTRSQTSLSRQKRRTNLWSAFAYSANQHINITNETIIIIDDIITTGSTLTHVAKVIKSHHPKVNVWGAVLWRHLW